MSADLEDGREDVPVELCSMTLSGTSRPGFDIANFPELAAATRDKDGVLNFSGTVAWEIDGYVCRPVINSTVETGKGFEVILDGGLSGHKAWQQGRSETWNVIGWIEDFGNGYAVLHPETINGVSCL